VIAGEDLPRYGFLLDPDFARLVAGGFTTVEVGEPVSFRPHTAYIEATARFRGQPQLGDQPGRLVHFAQGRPFPGPLAAGDAEAGLKAAWNMRYAYAGDSARMPELHWQLRDWASEKVDMEMLFAARGMRFMYRHVLEPVPFIAPNPEDAWGAFLLEAREAGSYDGAQALIFANLDEARQVNGWVYIPQLGRTQSLASFSTAEAMFGSDVLPTDFLAYSGRLVDLRWRYLGATFMLLPMYRHDLAALSQRKAREHDYWHADLAGHAGCFPKIRWQLRPVLILEGTAVDPAALATRRLFYLDAQTYLPVMWKIYREGDALWKIVLNGLAHPDGHVAANAESGAPIPTVFATIDVRTNRCTTVQILTLVNDTDVRPEDFDPRIMTRGRGRR
jgi:hypothetical protein